jgi:hypothetical protein
MQILGVALVLAALGVAGVWRLRGPPASYRAGPWPGLTPRGAGMVLAFALLLAAGVVLAELPLPWLTRTAWLCLFTLLPLALATQVVRVPGVCSAVCGAYLLPRTVLSLLISSLALPPPLLVPALVFDLVVWLQVDDLRVMWPRKRSPWRRRARVERSVRWWRLIVGGLLYGLVLALLEPAFAAFSGTGTGS